MYRKSDIDPTLASGEKLTSVNGDISISNISFAYPSRPDVIVLDNFSLDIKAGQTIGLVGPSGSGKSSIVALLQRFYDSTSDGSITLDGVDLRKLNLKWYRSQVGLVGQEPVLFSGTIAENIGFGKEGETATIDEIIEAAKSANAHNFITQFPKGYDTPVGEKGAQLSGGQKQRIAIARAIIKNPKILLLDEATSALDSESERVVQEALDKVMKGRTTIVVAHRLSTIQNANQIVVLQKGKVIEKGNHNDLIQQNGLYAELVQLQGLSTTTADTKERTNTLTLETSQVENEATAAVETEEEKAAKSRLPFLRLFTLNKPEVPLLLVGLVVACISGSIEPVFGVVFASVLTVFYEPSNQVVDSAIPWIYAFIGIGVLTFIIICSQQAIFGRAGELLTNRCRTLGFKAIIRQDVGWFDRSDHDSGVLTSRLSTDATLIDGLVGIRLGTIAQCVFSIAVGAGLALYFGWKLALVVLAVSPLLVLSQLLEFNSMLGDEAKEKDRQQLANNIASEAFQNVRTVASFTSEERIFKKYVFQLARTEEGRLKKRIINSSIASFGEFGLYLVYFISFWYGASLIRDGEMNFEAVMRVFLGILSAYVFRFRSLSLIHLIVLKL